MSTQDVVLITGANTGIGYQIVRALCESDQPYHIIIAGRSMNKVSEAISSAVGEFPSSKSKLSSLVVDIESDESINKAFEETRSKFGKIDVLINNAGAQLDREYAQGRMTEREMWNKSFNINVTGTHIMTTTFMPLLLLSLNPRLLFMTSGTSTLAGSDNSALAVNHYGPKGWPKSNFDGKNFGLPAYRSVKTGLNMAMREWHRLLHEDGVKVWAISPGMLATGLGGVGKEALLKMGASEPTVAGPFIRSVLEGARDADVGRVILKDGVQAW